MDVEITGRHIEVTEAMEGHIRHLIEGLPAFADRVQYINVTLEKASGNLIVECVAKSARTDLVAQAKGHEMYQVIDAAFGKLERQLTRQHDKLVSGRSREAQKTSEDERRPD